MHSRSKEKVEQLMRKGVAVPNPESVLIGDEVELDRIAGDGVVIYPGCKIFGEKTLIMSGVKLGYEGPVTVEDCQIGPDVELKGGFFRRS
ncbi:MAG: protein GlmU, partial [Desulfobacterales bacterium]|nr:protein GlmU [Desulfobacterales bacterium]